MDSYKAGQLAGRLFIAGLLLIAAALLFRGILAGVAYQERAECLNWQADGQTPATWQVAQCKRYDIELSRPNGREL
jgi:hypothetical protein